MRIDKGKLNQGQVGLTVLLIVVVMVTVGVAVAGRSVSELKTTRLEEESTRSLNLAESGVEQILNQNILNPVGTIQINNQPVNYTISSEFQIQNLSVDSGHSIEVNLVGYNQGGNPVIPGPVAGGGNLSSITVSWTTGACPNVAAIEVTIITSAGLRREAYDPCTRSPVTNFGTVTLPPQKSINLLSGDKMVRIKDFFATTQISVVGSDGGLPAQTYTVNAEAPVGSDNTTRAVSVKKFAGSLPSIFDYVLFSGTTITQ